MNFTSIPISEELYTYCNTLKQFEDEIARNLTLSDIILRIQKQHQRQEKFLRSLSIKEAYDES